MAIVFISYAREDAEIAKEIENLITANKHEVWRDTTHLLPGEKIPLSISRAITNCDYMIVLVSGNSEQSRWVRFEINNFLMNHLSGGPQLIIPMILDDTNLHAAFPELSAFNAIFYRRRSEQEKTKLIHALGKPSDSSVQKKENIERLEFAVDLAVRAGNLAMRFYNSSHRANQSLNAEKNASTLADRETQLEVIGALTNHPNYRHDAIIAEEDPSTA